MLRSQLPFANAEGTLVQRLGLFILALLAIEYSQIVEILYCVRVFRSQLLLIYSQGTLVQRLSSFILALLAIENSQIIQIFCSVRVHGS